LTDFGNCYAATTILPEGSRRRDSIRQSATSELMAKC
jgi:hypothetical protein